MLFHLKKVYGFNDFRKNQKDIIDDLLKGEDVFAMLPTGGGKSLLYQFPATFTNKISIVISPLISLMNDQCNFLNSKNIKSTCLNSESKIKIDDLKNNKIIYTTPEYLISKLQIFKNLNDEIGLFAIDEAHCISQWSHDFRQSYLELKVIKQEFPEIPLLTVTATAIPRVIEEMYDLLDITEVNEYLLGTKRTNLSINIYSKNDFDDCKIKEPTIIYVQTRKICEKLYAEFIEKGITCGFYHGGMDIEHKKNTHEQFMDETILVIIATISFGMGIDKSNIRHVINYGVPTDIETYYQEIGRAGRDGLESRASLYYSDADFITAQYLISKTTDEKQKKIKSNALQLLRQFISEATMCRMLMIEHYFKHGKLPLECDLLNIKKCDKCDNCLGNNLHEITDVTDDAKIIIDAINNHYKSNGFYVGVEKIINNIKNKTKSKKWYRDIINVLVNKNILQRIIKSFGGIIINGKYTVDQLAPIKIKIQDNSSFTVKNTQNNYLYKLTNIRNKLANNYSILPHNFINECVLLEINNAKPKNLTDLCKIDGISQEFIHKYGYKFMEELNNETKLLNKSSKLNKSNNRTTTIDATLEQYKKGKNVNEIMEIRKLKKITIEDHILHIFEYYDEIDIDVNYFGLIKEYELEIREAIKNKGIEKLKPIKEIVNPKITYAQIKLCILLIKLDEKKCQQ